MGCPCPVQTSPSYFGAEWTAENQLPDVDSRILGFSSIAAFG